MSFEETAGEEDEGLLVLLVQQGDVGAFEKLLKRLHRPLRAYVTKLVGEATADDVLQEVSFRIYRSISGLREPKVFRAWAFRIATRLSFAHLKREKRWRQVEDHRDVVHTGVAGGPLQEEFESDFLSLIEQVSAASRAVLLLHYQQHLSIEETAAILDIPIGTAKSRLSYGVATLRNLLKEKERR